ncbi:MAG: hypothetical protein WC792_02045 [Candidatus Micrarchaeia archaeon]
MADFVYFVAKTDERKLKEVLGRDPYADDSFVKVGSTLREAKAMGVEGDHFVLHYKCEDAAVGKKLEERLKEVPSAKPAPEKEKAAITAKLDEEQNAAASGFGSIFG